MHSIRFVLIENVSFSEMINDYYSYSCFIHRVLTFWSRIPRWRRRIIFAFFSTASFWKAARRADILRALPLPPPLPFLDRDWLITVPTLVRDWSIPSTARRCLDSMTWLIASSNNSRVSSAGDCTNIISSSFVFFFDFLPSSLTSASLPPSPLTPSYSSFFAQAGDDHFRSTSIILWGLCSLKNLICILQLYNNSPLVMSMIRN